MPLALVGSLIETCHARHLALMSDARIRTIIIFRNHGAAAGATLAHPHSQIIAMPFIPPEIERRQNIAARHAEAHGRCLYCYIVEAERRQGTRVIRETEDFIAFVPYAAAMPFEIWIVPKRHQACFSLIEAQERTGLADLLRDMVARIDKTLGDPGYNLVLASLTGADAGAGTHWYLAIHPRPITLGGFEIGAGMTISPSLPEQDAARLRSQR
jgi:UDPglucose--hexose-1-phosphate uridylyltransferase